MKLRALFVVATIATAVTVAKPHAKHRHVLGKRNANPDAVVYAPPTIETQIVYILDDYPITEEEVRQGLANGTLMWGEEGVLASSSPPTYAFAPPTGLPEHHDEPTHDSSATNSEAQPAQTPIKEAPQDTAPSSIAPAPSSPSDSSDSTAWSDLVDSDGNCASCDKEFPNGQLPCSKFPYGFGALPIDHEGLGGWSGIQDPQYRGDDGFDDITTVTKGLCNGENCCKPGAYCSYGCPNPYLKLSFPKKQGRTGQSVGGLYCNDKGFLELADGSIGKTLCGKGSQKMTVMVHNRLSKPVSFCRTDYPGKLKSV